MGRTRGIIRGCVFVPVRDDPVKLFFHTYHTNFNIKLPTLISMLYCCLVRGEMA